MLTIDFDLQRRIDSRSKLMANTKNQKGSVFVIMAVGSTVIGLPILFLIMSAMGEKTGIEFSPDDFSMRRFNYCRLPLINWTRRGIEYEDVSCPTGQTLIADDWVRVTGRIPKRWHLVSESSGYSPSRLPEECDARFLTQYFEFTDSDGANFLMKWTNENPTSAKALWPEIAELARDKLYVPIPVLLEFAIDHPKADQDKKFVDRFNRQLSKAWLEAAKTDQLGGKHEQAISRFEKAIEIVGNDAEIESQKQVSLDVLGGEN